MTPRFTVRFNTRWLLWLTTIAAAIAGWAARLQAPPVAQVIIAGAFFFVAACVLFSVPRVKKALSDRRRRLAEIQDERRHAGHLD